MHTLLLESQIRSTIQSVRWKATYVAEKVEHGAWKSQTEPKQAFSNDCARLP